MKPCHDLPIVGNGKAEAFVDWLCQAQGETLETQAELLRMETLQAGTSPWSGLQLSYSFKLEALFSQSFSVPLLIVYLVFSPLK